MIYDDFSDEQIQNASKKVMSRNTSDGKTEKEITRLVIDELKKTPTKSKKRTTAAIGTLDCRSFLGIDKKEAL